MILCRDDPAIPALTELGEPLYLLDANPTAENIVREIFEKTRAAGFPIVRARLWETPRCRCDLRGRFGIERKKKRQPGWLQATGDGLRPPLRCDR